MSVLIPTFDRPHFLTEAVRSVLAQTVGEFEIVIGDDGHHGAAVAAEVGDLRVRYQRNAVRLGLARNWEALIASARGSFLLLLMDDDRLKPAFLARCLTEFERDPELGVVFTNHTFARGENVHVRRSRLAPGRHDRFAEEFLRTRPVAVSGALWRSDLWPAVRPLPDTAASDMVLFGRLAGLGFPFFYVDEPLMHYRVHDAMYSSDLKFRDEAARAWESLSFTDAGAQRERNRLLAEALISRAAARVRDRDLSAARVDLVRASSLHPTRRVRRLAVRVAASNILFAELAAALADSIALLRQAGARTRRAARGS